MIPAVFINCRQHPFAQEILSGRKLYETRTRNMLGRFLGDRILIVETGNGSPLVVGSAMIDCIISVRTRPAWNRYRQDACIPVGSSYDWQPDTKVKWLYRLKDVRKVDPFPLPQDARRHGRVWAEYNEEV